MRIIVTGGAGFIGSAFVRQAGARAGARGAEPRQADLCGEPGGAGGGRAATRATGFVQADICDRRGRRRGVRRLRARRRHASGGREPRRPLDRRARRLHHDQRRRHLRAAGRRAGVLARPAGRAGATRSASCTSRPTRSTARSAPEGRFTETTPYDPNSPYSASKAAADHLVRAWHRTYGLPVVMTNCSNNYGPYQFPEKLIPLMIIKALAGKPLPVYGTGENVRDWLYVEDHARGIQAALTRGRVGENYNFGGASERTQHRGGPRDLRPARRAAAGRRTAGRASPDRASSPTGRATTRATPSTTPRPGPSWAGRRGETFETGLRGPSSGTWSIEPGGRRSAPGATPATGSASARRPLPVR